MVDFFIHQYNHVKLGMFTCNPGGIAQTDMEGDAP